MVLYLAIFALAAIIVAALLLILAVCVIAAKRNTPIDRELEIFELGVDTGRKAGR